MKDKAYIGDEKNIKDYLHLYLGCDCHAMGVTEDDYDDPVITKTMKLTGISYDDTQKQWWGYFENEEVCYMVIEEIFPILRPLFDMSEDEAKELESIGGGTEVFEKGNIIYSFDSHRALWALKKGFDLFGLIDAGLAIDKSTLNKQS